MQEWQKFCPVPIFTAKNGSPIHCLLDSLDEPSIQKVTKLLGESGGKVMNEPDEHTVILTGGKRTNKKFKFRPLFNYRWVLECVKAVQLLDINPYLINKSRFPKRNFMNVIYHKLETIDGIPINPLEFAWCPPTGGDSQLTSLTKRRRGPPKKKNYVLFKVDCVDDADDFFTENASTAARRAADQILLEDRLALSEIEAKMKNTSLHHPIDPGSLCRVSDSIRNSVDSTNSAEHSYLSSSVSTVSPERNSKSVEVADRSCPSNGLFFPVSSWVTKHDRVNKQMLLDRNARNEGDVVDLTMEDVGLVSSNSLEDLTSIT